LLQEIKKCYYENDKLLSEFHIDENNEIKGKYTWYNEAGFQFMEKWYKNGEYHRIGAPAIINNRNDHIIIEEWYQNGNLHRIGAPARTAHYKSGQVYKEEWYINGKLHRVGNPAYIDYYGSGKIREEIWYNNGKCHRIGNPAHIEFTDLTKFIKNGGYKMVNITGLANLQKSSIIHRAK
jgi:hypothetical protein